MSIPYQDKFQERLCGGFAFSMKSIRNRKKFKSPSRFITSGQESTIDGMSESLQRKRITDNIKGKMRDNMVNKIFKIQITRKIHSGSNTPRNAEPRRKLHKSKKKISGMRSRDRSKDFRVMVKEEMKILKLTSGVLRTNSISLSRKSRIPKLKSK